jgi:RNA polymerase sigma factor (sigma-70 family)
VTRRVTRLTDVDVRIGVLVVPNPHAGHTARAAGGRLSTVHRVPTATARWPALLQVIADARTAGESISDAAEALVIDLFHREGRSLVRLARLFVDDRDAAEDIVQEAFLRLARHAGRIEVQDKAPAYLRSIVLNLARDHNRRGLVSLRHQATRGREVDVADDMADRLVVSEEHRRVLAAVRQLPTRQRDCGALRYIEEYSIADIAATLGLSANSVKTHLQRGLGTLDRVLGEP